MQVQTQILLYLIFLVGIAVGSKLFYDLPIQGKLGIRKYLDAQNISFIAKEFWLIIIWSSLLSLGFLFESIVKLLVTQLTMVNIFWGLLKQVGLCIGLTTLSVTFFLLVFPEQPRMETARGIVAGLFLRIALFFALLLA